MNAIAGTCEEMMKRAVFVRELGTPIIMHDYLACGFIANITLAHYCQDNGLLHIHCAMHVVIDWNLTVQTLILKTTGIFLQSFTRLKSLWFRFVGNDLFTLKLLFIFVNIYNHLQG